MSIQTIRSGALEYRTAEGISVPHCFTTRLGGVSTGSQASLNLAVGRGDTLENVEENLKILANTLGFDLKKLVMTRQTHSDIVREGTAADEIRIDGSMLAREMLGDQIQYKMDTDDGVVFVKEFATDMLDYGSYQIAVRLSDIACFDMQGKLAGFGLKKE